MRDIRGDLQDRATMLEEHIRAANYQFEERVVMLKREFEDRLAEMRAALEAVNRLMELEHRRFGAAAKQPQQSALVTDINRLRRAV